MQQLTLGQHFGLNKNKVQMKDLIINEAIIDATAEVPWHYHENAYFLYNIRGTFLEINKKDQIACSPSTLLYHNWQEPHCNRNISDSADYFHIEIEKNWFEKHGIRHDVIQGSKNIQIPEVKGLFQRIYQELNVQDTITPLAVDGLLLQAFSLILRERHSIPTELQPKWIGKLKELFSSATTDQLELDTLANDIGISPVHLSRAFPRYFDTNFGQYVRSLKIERAKNLLVIGHLSNSQIAYECGFSDESHFIKVFKAQYGLTPGKYRQQVLGNDV